MTMEAAIAFRDALLGLQSMHRGGWMHRDLKPSNIGLIGTPARAVLLDNGTSAHLRPGTLMKPTPGRVGTIGFLAPELEIKDYDHSIDIWAMGITLYCLTYNRHPWRYALNPWRNTKENEKLRPEFQKDYQAAITRMMKDYKAALKMPMEGHIHRKFTLRARETCSAPSELTQYVHSRRPFRGHGEVPMGRGKSRTSPGY
jgi:serine/threonine protein kinase